MPSREIFNPKRERSSQSAWESFFPYYAGYSEKFVQSILDEYGTRRPISVLDPWNGSGTTSYVASRYEFGAIGADINPAMLVVAKARLLCPSEADSLVTIAQALITGKFATDISNEDALSDWFNPKTAASIRHLESRIRTLLVGNMTLTNTGTALENLSSLAALFYVALFSVCRSLAKAFRTTNPTWLKKPRDEKHLANADTQEIKAQFLQQVTAMTDVLLQARNKSRHDSSIKTILADSTSLSEYLEKDSVDVVITSPPYCTRIDYTSATAIELAVMDRIICVDYPTLKKSMIGSVSIPSKRSEPDIGWGSRCLEFLQAVENHPSKASSTYYLRTHIDYFDKMYRSIDEISSLLKNTGDMYMVVQDSFYKEIHNDLPAIMTEMADSHGFQLVNQVNFRKNASISGMNSRSRVYVANRSTTESVLHFVKLN